MHKLHFEVIIEVLGGQFIPYCCSRDRLCNKSSSSSSNNSSVVGGGGGGSDGGGHF